MVTRNIVGQVPEPEDLFGRQDMIDHIGRQLDGNNILLLGPRRFGKSGVMRHLLRHPPAGYLSLYLDLMDVDSPSEFVSRLVDQLLALEPLRAALGKVKGLPAAIRDAVTSSVGSLEYEGAKVELRKSLEASWRDLAKRLIVELDKAGQTLLLLLDEFPVMVAAMAEQHGVKEARDFMAWFSVLRLQSRDTLRRHRFVVAGSIGIDAMLRRIDPADKLRDFERVPVGAIDDQDALELVQGLASVLDIRLVASLPQACLDLIGPRVPFFIHLLFSQLAQLRAEDRQPLRRETLEAVYREKILGPASKSRFEHYRDRLRQYGRPRERAAMAILKAVADEATGRVGASALYDIYRSARGRGATELEFDELLADLECDWYLALDPQTNEYYFLVNVMRDWWRRWYGARRRPAGGRRGA